MKVKTSVTLSEQLLEKIDERANGNRSEFLERAARDYIRRMTQAERDRRDVDLYNRHLDELNAEAEDVLRDQVDPFALGDEVETLEPR